MGVTVSSSHVVSATSSSSGGGLLSSFPCSSMESLSQETVLHKLLQHESLPRETVLHELLQHGSLPRGSDLQEQTAPAWDPPRGHKSCQQTCPGVGSPLHRSTGPARNLLQCGLPTGHSLLQVPPPAPAWGPPWAAGGISTPPHPSSMGCRGTACLTMAFTTGCRGISALVSGAPPPPPSALTLVSAEFLTSSHSSLRLQKLSLSKCFSSS